MQNMVINQIKTGFGWLGVNLRLFTVSFIWLFTLAAILVSLNRFWQFEVFYYDFGIFDQAIWRVAHFKPPIIEHLVVGGKWIFADHFSPGLFLLSPLYWITDRPEIMLIAQAVAVGASALILRQIAQKLLNQPILELAVIFSYCLFVGLQNALITDIHEVTFMLVPLTLAIKAIVWGQKKSAAFWFLFTLLFKESAFLLGVGLGLFTWYVRPKWWKFAIGLMLAAAIWGYVVIDLIIPAFSQTGYAYKPSFYAEPWKNIYSMVDEPLKRQTQFNSLWSFGFLPLLSPASWPLIGQDWVVRFVPQGTGGRWTMGMHYSAQLAPLLAIGMIYGLVLVKTSLAKVKWLRQKAGKLSLITYEQLVLISLGSILCLNALYLHRFKLNGPLGLAYNKAFYQHSEDFDFLNRLIDQIPDGASVMTQNNLATRFTHRQMWLLRDEYHQFKPDYILLDVRPDQNPNNFFPKFPDSADKLLLQIKADPNYAVVFETKYQWIFKRIN